MRQQDIEATLIGLLAKSLNTDPADAAAQLVASEGMCDSLVGVEVIIAMEEAFGISVPDDALVDICHSIPAMVRFVAQCLSHEMSHKVEGNSQHGQRAAVSSE